MYSEMPSGAVPKGSCPPRGVGNAQPLVRGKNSLRPPPNWDRRYSTGSRVLILLMLLAGKAGWAAPVALSRQVITFPANASEPLFVDIEGNGRADLLVMDPVERKLLTYLQRPDGFSN